ncbi:hypothetical protein AMD27_17770 (plasmid) [Acinetobacter sp. TGL-Y2]|uniref:hypothetical protein n=1 Tax=Acinetobacter sp. TGL-Y2 TaxID=1407071 RepID=UPI0007A67F74|nr:hypothetical protein [Acinetobacter sp. TGL-Y2]AMW80765.1 hypothetical protein AMD27_17770 [Acinetobacter sp. TGL-Y2]
MSGTLKKEFYKSLMDKGLCKINSIPVPFLTNLDQDYTENQYYNQQDSSISIQFLRSQDFLKTIQKLPLYVTSLPVEYFSEAELWKLLSENINSILTFPNGSVTKEMYHYAVGRDYRLFAFLDNSFQNIDIVKEVLAREPLMLEYVQESLAYYYICESAIIRNWRALRYVPIELFDDGLMEIAKKNKNAFLLDIIPSNFIKSELYSEQFRDFPKESINYVVDTLLTDLNLDTFIGLLDSGDTFTPEDTFKSVDPSIIFSPNKSTALIKMLEQRPKWVHYLEPAGISSQMYEAVIQRNVYPKLTPLAWDFNKISIAYEINRKAFSQAPIETINSIGGDRLLQIFLTAIEQKWVEALPFFFFTGILINNPDAHTYLMEYRTQYSIAKVDSVSFDFEKLKSMNFAVDELLLVESKAESEFEELFELNIANYVVFPEREKTLDRTIAFLKIYPMHVNQIPNSLLENKSSAKKILNEVAQAARFIEAEKITAIYSSH